MKASVHLMVTMKLTKQASNNKPLKIVGSDCRAAKVIYHQTQPHLKGVVNVCMCIFNYCYIYIYIYIYKFEICFVQLLPGHWMT